MSSQSTEADRESLPRAVIHKQILEVASEQPNASIDDLAGEIDGASPDLVERVLEKHGDPAAPEQDGDVSGTGENPVGEEEEGVGEDEDEVGAAVEVEAEDGIEDEVGDGIEDEVEDEGEDEVEDDDGDAEVSVDTDADDSEHQAFEEFTDNQREVLQEIQANPSATQTELAETLDVSQPTINSRLNSIEGFDWQTRHEFVQSMVDANGQGIPETDEQLTERPEIAEQLDELTEQVEALSGALDDQDTTNSGVFGDVELDCKVIRACLDADDITAAEADTVMKTILTGVRQG